MKTILQASAFVVLLGVTSVSVRSSSGAEPGQTAAPSEIQQWLEGSRGGVKEKKAVNKPAAPLKIKEWVKGKAVDVLDGKNVYVVEFWATWCPPCRKSIPHLTEIQKKYKEKGVVVVGVSSEKPDVVKPFVAKMADQMDYTVAIDDGNATSQGFMAAYGERGIPHAFVVGKDGKVSWHGHPANGLEEALDKALSENK